jgi:hypothetical protein
MLGATVIPWSQVTHVELGVGGGAMWGFTLIADYSDNRIVEVDDQGRIVFELRGGLRRLGRRVPRQRQPADHRVLGQPRAGGRPQGQAGLVFEDLKNPYDADRLPNGNTLIADTFGSRVIEVDRPARSSGPTRRTSARSTATACPTATR